jgi:nucleoside-diphosphate-sugar epimerase
LKGQLELTSSERPLGIEDMKDALEQTESLWRAQAGSRFFVTGGTGFFGKWLQETFAYANSQLNLNAEMVVLTRDPQAAAQAMPHLSQRQISYVNGDVTNITEQDGEFSHLIHAATEVNQLWKPELAAEQLEVSCRGTESVLSLARENPESRLLFVSSGAVYGTQNQSASGVGFQETDALNVEQSASKSAYAEAKRLAELLVLNSSQTHGHHVNIARCFAFIGPHLQLDGTFAAGQFIRQAVSGEPIQINGSGLDQRSYLYASELAVWLWTILFKGENSGIYNVGSPTVVTILDVAREVAAAFGAPTPLLPKNPAAKSGRYLPDVTKAGTLGLRARFDLRESAQRTAKWWKSGGTLSKDRL